MAAASTEPSERQGLHVTVVEATVRAAVGGVMAAARVRANWGRLEVTVAQPTAAAGIRMSHDRRGFIFALGCQAEPKRRFTDGRRLTPAGEGRARGMLRELIRDYQVVCSHPQAIAELWLRVTALIRSLHDKRDAIIDPQQRRTLRHRHREGALDQAHYQRLRRQLVQRDQRREQRYDLLARRARRGFATRTGRLCGRELELEVVGQLLSLNVVHGALPAALRRRIEAVSSPGDRR